MCRDLTPPPLPVLFLPGFVRTSFQTLSDWMNNTKTLCVRNGAGSCITGAGAATQRYLWVVNGETGVLTEALCLGL